MLIWQIALACVISLVRYARYSSNWCHTGQNWPTGLGDDPRYEAFLLRLYLKLGYVLLKCKVSESMTGFLASAQYKHFVSRLLDNFKFSSVLELGLIPLKK